MKCNFLSQFKLMIEEVNEWKDSVPNIILKYCPDVSWLQIEKLQSVLLEKKNNKEWL